jgi:hypothetical protein
MKTALNLHQAFSDHTMPSRVLEYGLPRFGLWIALDKIDLDPQAQIETGCNLPPLRLAPETRTDLGLLKEHLGEFSAALTPTFSVDWKDNSLHLHGLNSRLGNTTSGFNVIAKLFPLLDTNDTKPDLLGNYNPGQTLTICQKLRATVPLV